MNVFENRYGDSYDHVEHDSERLAKCRRCDKVINYTSTSHNLKIHLRRHGIVVPLQKSAPERKSRNPYRGSTNLIWGYFTKVDIENRMASCDKCSKALSYRATTGNLRSHLEKKHPELYLRLSLEMSTDLDAEDIEYLEVEEVSGDEKAEASSFFEREAGGRARCAICRDSMHHDDIILKRHLREKHPKLIDDSESEPEEQKIDEFQEVIYLEDTSNPIKEDPMVPNRKYMLERRLERNRQREYRRRRSSTSSPERKSKRRTEPKSQDDEEVDFFGSYVTCLLKKLPRDLCMKVQRDIINLIMNAKLNQQPEDVVMDNVMQGGSCQVIPNVDRVEKVVDRGLSGEKLSINIDGELEKSSKAKDTENV